MAPVTVIDVARHAGVSKSTVSNVVRGKAVVAPETKARVEAALLRSTCRVSTPLASM